MCGSKFYFNDAVILISKYVYITAKIVYSASKTIHVLDASFVSYMLHAYMRSSMYIICLMYKVDVTVVIHFCRSYKF